MISPTTERRVLLTFKQRKVMAIKHLAKDLHCSIPTVRKRLKSWKTFTSYNKNGSYYTLPAVPRFDENGLWKYKGIYFSQHGNMKQTIIELVRDSELGLAVSEIGELLGLVPRSFASHVKALQELRREQYEGKYVYFSAEKEQYLRQRKNSIPSLSAF